MRAKQAGNFSKLNCRKRSERNIFGKFCTFPPNSSKLRSDYLFSFQKRTNYLFQAFSRSEYLFPKSASPPRTNYLFQAFSRSEYLFPKSASPPPPLRIKINGRPLKWRQTPFCFKLENDPRKRGKILISHLCDFSYFVQRFNNCSRLSFAYDVRCVAGIHNRFR